MVASFPSGRKRTGAHPISVHDGEDPRPVVARGECGRKRLVIGFRVGPIETDQDDAALRWLRAEC